MNRIGAALDRGQRRHAVFGVPVAVYYKFLEDQGLYLAAVIAFYGMLSLFPLLLLLSSVVGLMLQGNPDVQNRIIEVAVHQVPTLSESFVRRQLSGSGVSLVIGLLGALFGALGVGTAVQNAMNVVWDVPRRERPNPFLLRLRSLGLLFILLLFVLLTTALTQLSPIDEPWVPGWLSGGVGTASSFVITTLVFELITKVAVRRRLTFVERLPGALLGAVLWQLLQTAGAAYISWFVTSSTIADGVFGSLLGVLVWVFLAGLSLVIALEFNVVVVDKLYPRSLAVIFMDNANLTEADMRVFDRRASAQQFKSYQRIDVDFDDRFELQEHRAAQRDDGGTRADEPRASGNAATGGSTDVEGATGRRSGRRTHDASAP